MFDIVNCDTRVNKIIPNRQSEFRLGHLDDHKLVQRCRYLLKGQVLHIIVEVFGFFLFHASRLCDSFVCLQVICSVQAFFNETRELKSPAVESEPYEATIKVS